MNRSHFSLERLLRAAAQAPQSLPTQAPFALEARVLAAWRAGAPGESATNFVPLLRRAFICACAILAISAALGLGLRSEAPNELIIVDSVIELTLNQ